MTRCHVFDSHLETAHSWLNELIESLDLVRTGKAPKVPQDHAKATYEYRFKKELAEIDWSKPAADVYNLIRAVNPAPGAWTTIKGTKVDFYDSAKVEGGGAPGLILDITDAGMKIAAGSGAILVKRVRAGTGTKVTAAEFAASTGLESGDKFDQPKSKAAA